MPHFEEMPSFAPDDTGPAITPTHALVELPNHVRQSYEKTNGNTRTSSYTSYKDGMVDGADSPVENGEVVRSQANGDMAQSASLNTIPNGRSSASSWERKSSRNGSALSINGGSNGVVDNGRNSGSQNGLPRLSNGDRNSAASVNGISSTPIVESPVQMSGGRRDSWRKSTVSTPVSANPHSTGPSTYTSSLFPGPQFAPDTPDRTTSPHRFSSPPAYATPLTTSTSANSLQHSSGAALQHRHTLQVPKVVPGRSSRDDTEVGHSTGRFSPTAIASGMRRGSLNLHRRHTQSMNSNVPPEDVPVDEDAMRWAEAIRQKRASKRRRKDDDEDDRVVVGTKVDQNHVNWVTAYNMLTGIRFTVSRTNAKQLREVTLADFDAKHKFSFDITGNELTPSAKYDFKFKDYAPLVFRHLRAKFKLDPADYLMSLTSKYILSELGSPGKSGSFFYFSRDYKYIIKTIHHAEHKFLRKILKQYYDHVVENPNTLLSQFYGLHRVKIPYGRKIHFVVMNNLFPPHRDIHQTFDLKGSTVGRDFKEENLEKNPRATLKDLNWLRRNLHLEFGPEKKRIFIEQMERDVHLLQKLKIMDYSMLVGIHDLQKGNQENLRDKTLQVFQPGSGAAPADETPDGRGALSRTPSKLENVRKARELRQIIKQEKPIPMGQSSSRMPDQMEENTIKRDLTFYSDDGGFRATHEDNSAGDEIFFLSIIDCLTHYGTIKKLEHIWKGLSHDKKLISPIRPEPYGERFIRFIEGITKSPEEATREAQAPPPRTNSNSLTFERRNTTSLDSSRRRSGSQPMHRTATNNPTIQRNESEALKTEANGESNKEVEPRMITTVRSSSMDRNGAHPGQTLPVVEEMGEASSTGGRSFRSVEREERPPTPPKDDDRPSTPPKDNTLLNGGPRMKKTLSRSSLHKDLPPLPPQEN